MNQYLVNYRGKDEIVSSEELCHIHSTLHKSGKNCWIRLFFKVSNGKAIYMEDVQQILEWGELRKHWIKQGHNDVPFTFICSECRGELPEKVYVING